MRRLRILCVMLAMLLALALPGTVFAQSTTDPGPEWNIRIEYRYTKGEESKLNIPGSISKYGRAYHLVSRTDPVLEKKLPATRVYTWLVDDTIPESELALLKGMEGVQLTPTMVEIGRVADKHETLTGLPTNDVEALPYTKTYSEGEFIRAAVRFEIEDLDEFNLPSSYEAEIVYRGLETYMGPGYEVRATYMTEKNLEGVPVYVVVATFAPDGLASASNAGGGSNRNPVLNGDEKGDGNPLAVLVPPVDNDNAGSSGEDPGQTVISEDPIPESSGESKEPAGISPWLLIPIIALICIGCFMLWLYLTKRKIERKRRVLREEKRKETLRAYGLVEYDG